MRRAGNGAPFGGTLMLSVVILICSLSISPHDCNDSNAREVVSGGEARTIAACTIIAQQTLTRVSVSPAPGREYIKVQCVPQKTE